MMENGEMENKKQGRRERKKIRKIRKTDGKTDRQKERITRMAGE